MENIYCEDLLVYFTKYVESFGYASSARSQNIDCLRSRLKTFRINWWIEFFSEATETSLFKLHLSSNQECLPIFQAELNNVSQNWNLRQVQQTPAAPEGKPDVLFYVPETILS